MNISAHGCRLLAFVTLIAATLSGCVDADERFFDEADGIADSYFAGAYSYEISGKTVNIQIYLKDKKYLLEENDKLTAYATLHLFKSDIYILQTRLSRPDQDSKKHIYFLIRKSPRGFDVGFAPPACRAFDVPLPCTAKTREELLTYLDKDMRSLDISAEYVAVIRR